MSGILHCLKCGQTVKAESFDKADELIDHAATSKECSGNPSYMQWTENDTVTSETRKKSTTKKSK